MKTVALSILMVSSVFLAKADIITVKTYTVKHFTHITGISTKQAIDSGGMNYLKRQVGENTFIFDFDNKTLVINGKAPC